MKTRSASKSLRRRFKLLSRAKLQQLVAEPPVGSHSAKQAGEIVERTLREIRRTKETDLINTPKNANDAHELAFATAALRSIRKSRRGR